MFVFYSEYSKIGGVENLILNISKFLFFKQNEKVKVICKKGSYLYNKLKEFNIEFYFCDLNSKQYEFFVNRNDILIKTDFGNLNQLKNLKCKFLYWEVIPTHLVYSISRRFLFSKSLFINFLLRNKGMCFMDDNSIVALKKEGYNINFKSFLPIPIEESKLQQKKKVTAKVTKLSYIGRDVDWKIYPILKVINDLSQIAEQNFDLNIYCDSNINFLKFIPANLKNLKINYIFDLSGIELQKSLLKNSDLHFGMGTSALEGSILGIPTILLDFSDDVFPENYRYYLLYETVGYSLGRPIDMMNSFEGKELSEIFELFEENQYNLMSERCKKYALENHEISVVVRELKKISEKSMVSCCIVNKLWSLMYYENKFRSCFQLKFSNLFFK